ncbi:CD276 antigen homolog [Callorhinchus milii]|uniref:CD276 antigen homolog n=1 Tax=Callorhinchus milii TaxID=7868 RepID=UPI0004573A77|nr:CD276 antigen homolog [Callorhinchus milii]|eukprot:gi/632949184/ref/XP_007890004.1/ PREDICTED: CD276 antigen-like isoform X2 [Callorhinchus milii]
MREFTFHFLQGQVFGVNINITVVIGDTVELPCNTILNESRNNPRISMQTHRHHVVHSFSSGKDDPAYQHPQFKNRTKIIYWPKLAIKLSNVSFTDEGAYICNIQEKRNDEYETTHSFEFNLYPTELYYSPTITTACKDKAKCGAEVNLICSSSHGYPESTVEWKNETGNIVLEGAITNFDCDPVNHQCNFTSVLKITVTTKVKIICSVLNLSLQDNRRLAEIILGSDIANPQKNNKKGLVIGMVAITVMLVVTCLGIIIWRSRSTSYTISEQEQQEQHFNLQSVPHPE